MKKRYAVKMTGKGFDNLFESEQEVIYNFVKKEKQVTYKMLMNQFKLPETTFRRKIGYMLRDNVLTREKCICGQGWVYGISKRKK